MTTPKTWTSNLSIWLIVIAIGLTSASQTLYFLGHPLFMNTDQALYLEIAGLILDGKVLYRDIWEWNPPLIAFLNIAPVWLANCLKLPPSLLFNLTCLLLYTASTFASFLIASKYLSLKAFKTLLPMILAFYLLNHSYCFNIGEREQLYVIFFFPLLILRSIRCIDSVNFPNWLAVLTGAYASLGILLKPQFILTTIGFETTLYLVTRRQYKLRTSEIGSVAACTLLYLLSLLLIPLEAWVLYSTEILPAYAYGFEWAKEPILAMLTKEGHIRFAMISLLLSTIISALLYKQHKLTLPLLAFMFVSLFNYLYGGQVWFYRAFPVQAGAFLLVGLTVGILLNKWESKSAKAPVLPILATAVILFAGFNQIRDSVIQKQERSFYPELDMQCCGYTGKTRTTYTDGIFGAITKESALEDQVLFMGSGITPGYPAILQSGRKPCSRFLFCVVGHIGYCQETYGGKKWDDLQEKVINTHIDEVNRIQPKLIFIESPSILRILQKYPFFEKCMGNYRKIYEKPIMKHFWVYKVSVR